MNFINKGIDKYEELCEEFLVPTIKTGINIVKENEYINPLLKLRTEFIKNKINLYFNNLNLKTEDEKLDFIRNLKSDDEKRFFMEIINKVIDLDDSLQNYIMSILTESFKENGDLNYYEKKLYYNINSLSEDDFQIYYCILNKHLDSVEKGHILNKSRIYIDLSFKNFDIINTSLSRFSNLGILPFKTETNQIEKSKSSLRNDKKKLEKMELRTLEYYNINDYTTKLFELLRKYFKVNRFDCDEILEIP